MPKHTNRFSHHILADATINLYDLAAALMIELSLHIPYEALFIGGFFGESSNQAFTNPNLSELEKLKRNVKSIAEDCLNGEQSIIDGVNRIVFHIYSASLLPFGNPAHNALTPFWSAVLGLDLAFSGAETTSCQDKRGPLNCFGLEKVGVYFRCSSGAIKNSLGRRGIDRSLGFSFNDQLSTLSFFQISSVHGAGALPQAVRIPSINNDKSPTEDPKVRLGFCLLSASTMFSLDHGNAYPAFIKKESRGSLFGVSYADWYENQYDALIGKPLAEGIERDCDILVFPEITISSACLEKLSEQLRSLKNKHQLKLVVAGSGWHTDSGENNICVLLDANGRVVGRHFKSTPFLASRPPTTPLSLEGLETPGAQSVIVDVGDLGGVLPFICMDFVMLQEPFLHYMDVFNPQFAIVPAFSHSLKKGFEASSLFISGRYLSVVGICNLCAARKNHEFRTTVAAITLPQAVPTKNERYILTTSDIPLQRTYSDFCRCESSARLGQGEGCMRVIEIDYSSDPIDETIPLISESGCKLRALNKLISPSCAGYLPPVPEKA